MRKFILTAGVLVFALATVFVWSRSSLRSSQATPGETVGLSLRAAISPFDMIVNRVGPALPDESWPAH